MPNGGMLGRVVWLFRVFLLVISSMTSFIARRGGGVEELNTALLCRWCEELAVIPCAHAVLMWWFPVLWGSSASVCDRGLTRGSTFLLDPIRLPLCLEKKCLGLMKFQSALCGWKGAATVRERTVARSRAPKWPAWPFSMQRGHGQRCLVALGRSKEWGRGIGCPGWPLG